MANKDEPESGNGEAKDAPTRVAPGEEGAASAAPQAVWQLVSQYIKDLSFENPGAPGTVLGGAAMPRFDVNINVQVKREPNDIYAVDLALVSKAMRDDAVLFSIELVYGGAFRVQNVPEAQLPPLLMVECPRLLFPFARQVLANTTQAGGFPPIMMEPVDFAAIYRRNLQNMAEANKAKADAAPN